MMKTGTDSPVKTGLAILLAIVAVFYIARWLIGSNGTTATTQSSAAQVGKKGQRVNSLDPTLRTDLLRDVEDTKYESKGRNIFLLQAELPKVVQSPVVQQQPQQIYQGPPPPPPINVKFFGFANRPGESKRIFLSSGEDIWVAKEGDIVNRRYKVVKINANSVEIEDVLSNNRQSIPLSQG
jgi:hypothetical protein